PPGRLHPTPTPQKPPAAPQPHRQHDRVARHPQPPSRAHPHHRAFLDTAPVLPAAAPRSPPPAVVAAPTQTNPTTHLPPRTPRDKPCTSDHALTPHPRRPTKMLRTRANLPPSQPTALFHPSTPSTNK